MRVLICGDRNWTNYEAILLTVRSIIAVEGPIERVIHGAARGADTLAGQVADALRIPQMAFRAQWAKYGKAAGVIRNQQMLDEGHPDLVLAFHNDLDSSKGTKDMVRRARKSGIEVKVYVGG